MHRSTRISHAALTALAALAAPGLGQTVFPTSQQLDESLTNLRATEVFDIDGDGHQDILAVTGIDARISMFPGEGQGAFGRPHYLEPITSPALDLVQGDFDADGRQDFIATMETATGQRAILFRNRGDFVFSRIAVGSWVGIAAQIGAEDFDGDGDLDFIYRVNGLGAPGGTSGLFVLNFNGTGFDTTPTVVTTTMPSKFQSVDVNGDGRCDVVMKGLADETWRLSTSLGPSGFSTPRSVFPASVSQLPGMQVVDIDQDGLLDIVAVPDAAQRLIHILRGQGVLDFAAPFSIATSRNPHPHPGMVRDYDGDGVMDLTFGESINVLSTRNIMRGLGGFNYEFDKRMLFSVFLGTFADLNGDGSLEALGGSVRGIGYDERVSTIGNRWYDTSREIQRWTGYVRGEITIDADGDGDKDLVVYGSDVGTSWYENEGGGSFARAVTFEVVGDFRRVTGGHDVNGDGFDDMLVRTSGTSGLAVRLYRGPLTYDPPIIVSSTGTSFPIALLPLHLDADGDLDFIQMHPGIGGIQVFALFNNGLGTGFPRQALVQGGLSGMSSAVVLDLDENGFDDVVTLGPAEAQIHLNQGTGTFDPPVSHTAAILPHVHSSAIDVDGDGDLDIVARNTTGLWHWSPNLPGPGIEPFVPLAIAGIDDAFDLAKMDLNQDGVDDLVAFGGAVTDGNADTLLLADGTGGFLAPEPIGAPYPATYRTRFLDVDSDGDVDAFSTRDATALLLHINESTPAVGMVPDLCSSGATNSSGRAGQLTAYGSSTVGSVDLTLAAYRLPENQFGMFIGALTLSVPVVVPGSLGSICLGGNLGRYDGPSQVQSSGAQGQFSIPLDPTALETSSGTVAAAAGETWYFQAWHRDLTPGGAPTSNFTSALGLTFAP